MNGRPSFTWLLAALICGGFIGVTMWLVARPGTELSQAATITVSMLASAFATIVNYLWGSSEGSRVKDEKLLPPAQTTPQPRPVASPPAGGKP